MSLGQIMNTGLQSMSNAKVGISTTSHNIANADTEGYSRQKIEQVTKRPVVRQGVTIGTGARIKNIKRISDDFIERQMREDTSLKGTSKSTLFGFSQLEQIFNESGDKSVNFHLSKFFGSLQRLSENPENGAIREMVKNSAFDLTKAFNETSKQIVKVRDNVDDRIQGLVQEANFIAKEIASLNGSIKHLQSLGKNANDLVDERNVKVKRLASIIDIKAVEDESGNFIVTVATSGNIIDNTDTFELMAPGRGGSIEQKTIHLLSPNGGEKNITNNMASGELYGYLDLRNNVLQEYMGRANEVAGTIITEFNEVHNQGYGLNGKTGIDFFQPLDMMRDKKTGELYYDFSNAAEKMSISDDIKEGISNIAAGVRPSAPADNRNILDMLEIGEKKILDEGASTINEFYDAIVGSIGLGKKGVENNLSHREGVLAQLNAMRESISGVSLDEETTQLMKYQHEFDAAAKMITVADELLDTVLALKR